MARRRGPRDNRMGVGGMAGGLEYGQRGTVESTAMSPTAGPTTGPIGPAQGPPNLGMAIEPFAPTERPDQPITAGMEPDAMAAPNPSDVLAAMYRRFPYPDLRRLLERSQQTDWNSMARHADAAQYQGQADRMMQEGQDPDRSNVGPQRAAGIEENLGGIPRDQGGGRFPMEGEDPDRSRLSPEEQAETEQRMETIRRDRSGGRF